MRMRIVILVGLALVGCTGAAPSPSPFAGKIVPAALDPGRLRPPRPSNVEIQRVPRAPKR
jgi:hypothetical protein